MKKFYIITILFLLGYMQVFSQKNIQSDKELLKLKSTGVSQLIYQNPNVSNLKNMYSINDYGDAPSWIRSGEFGGSALDNSNKLAKDSEGNIYITGNFFEKISFNSTTLTSVGILDGFIAKFDPAGNIIWFKQLKASVNNYVHSYGIDIKGDNIFITGNYTGTATIGSINLPDKNNNNLFFAKLSLNGDVLFAKNYENTSNSAGLLGKKVLISEDENYIYILAQLPVGTQDWEYPSQLLKFDTNGKYISSFNTTENISDFTFTPSGICFTGTINDDGYIGNYYFNPNYYDAFIAKCNTDFNIEWAWMAEHTTDYAKSYGLGVVSDENGNLIFTGNYLNNNIKIGNIILYGSVSFLTKLTYENSFQWAENLNFNNRNVNISGNNNHIILSSGSAVKKVNFYDGSIVTEKTLSEKINSSFINSTGDIIYLTGSDNGFVYLSKTNGNFNNIWDFTFGGNSAYGDVISTETDKNNNVYTYGFVSSDVNFFGHQIDKGNFLCKQKPDGQVCWIKSFPDISVHSNYGVFSALDPAHENIFITGYFNDVFTLPNGEQMVADENGSVFVLQFGVDGTFKKAVKFDAIYQQCITVDNNENVILSGTFYNTINIGGTQLTSHGSDDAFIIKFNMDNNVMWVLQAGGGDIEYSGLVSADIDGNVYFSGEFCSETIQLGDNQLTLQAGEGDGNIVLAKISPEGNVLWAKTTGGSALQYGDYSSWPTGIKVSNDGSFYLKGCHGDSTYFDNYILYSPHYRFSKFIAKFNSTGDCIWVHSINEYYFEYDYNKMDIDNNDNVYIGLQVRDTIEFGNDYQYIPEGNADLVFAKYLNNGTLDWIKTMQGEGASWLSSISVYDSTVTVGGWFINSFTIGDSNYVSHIGHGFLAQCGKDYNGIIEVYNRQTLPLTIFPNPMKDKTNIKFENKEHSSYTLSIYNVSGQMIREIRNIKTGQVTILRNTMKRGTYFIEIIGKNKYSGKLIVE